MPVAGALESPWRVLWTVDIFYKITDVFGRFVLAHADDGRCLEAFGRFEHFDNAEAMGSIHVEARTEQCPPFVNGRKHLFPAVEMFVCPYVYHRTIVADGCDALSFQGVDKRFA